MAIKNNEKFIMELKSVHGDLYDYSRVVYSGSANKIEILCKIHGSFFLQANKHLRGAGCQKCSKREKHEKIFKKSLNKFISKATKVHGYAYDYSNVNFNGSNGKIEIVCKLCGKHILTTPQNHILGRGCLDCLKNKLKFEKFLKDFKLIDGCDDFDFSNSFYSGCKSNMRVFCKICNEYFYKSPYYLLKGVGCPKCKDSIGERKIKNFLRINSIVFEQQFRFSECKDKRTLPFDFAVFEDKEKTKLKLLIEFDGIGHYEQISWNGNKKLKTLEGCKKRDSIKNNYCKNNNLKLIRIPYWDIHIINEILNKEIKIED